MAPHRIHVAVLDADIPCQSVYAKRGLYSSQFKTLLQAAATRLNKNDTSNPSSPLSVHVTAFDAVGGSLPPLECLRSTSQTAAEPLASTPPAFSAIDAILITGSSSSAYDPHPWISSLASFIQIVHKDYPLVKIFGSCFGHQIIAQALLSAQSAGVGLGLVGGDANEQATTQTQPFHVKHSPKGFEMGIQPITLNPEFTAHFPPLARANPFRIQLIHGDIVVPVSTSTEDSDSGKEAKLPAPWMNIGCSDFCQIQGLYLPGRILTYQGHFEFDAWGNAELTRYFGWRFGWEGGVVRDYIGFIERSVGSGPDDDDDSKAAAEAVVLLFAGRDGSGQVGGASGAKGGFVEVDGMLTPPLEGSG
jgi:GMP synthase-like glutamine amidotransferase